MDLKEYASRLGIGEEDFRELADLFMVTCRSDLEKLRRGVMAGISEEAAFAAHSIKGAAGNLGFNAISDLAKEMEIKARKGSLEGFNDYIDDLETRIQGLGIG